MPFNIIINNIEQQEVLFDAYCDNIYEMQPECNSPVNITNSSEIQFSDTQEVNNIEQQKIFSDTDCDNNYDNENENNDSDYCYSGDSESSEENNNVQLCSEKSNNTIQNSAESSLNVTGTNICDDSNLSVIYSKPKGEEKLNFCYFCKKMQTKISRHLERVHKNEEEVKKFAVLPKGTES